MAGTFFTRYDYENVDSDGAKKLTAELARSVGESGFVGSSISGRVVTEAGDFSYTDPVDGSVAKNQGLYVKFDDGSRFVVRLSGTGSSGATIRLYVEKHDSVWPPLFFLSGCWPSWELMDGRTKVRMVWMRRITSETTSSLPWTF